MTAFLAWLGSSSEVFLRYGVWGLFAVAFAESSFFPVPPDLLLIPMSILNPRLALWYALVCTVASVAGGVFGHFIGWRAGRPLLSRLFSEKMIDRVDQLFSRYGGWAVGIAAFTPIPYKVFTIAAGVFHMNRAPVIIASIIGRGGRFFLVAALIMALGQRGLEFISSNFELITLGLTALVLGAWYVSRRTRFLRAADIWLSARGAAIRDVYQRRFYPLGVYGYYLIAGLGLAGTSLILFTRLATEMLEQELDAFDATILNATRSWGGPALRAVMRGLSWLGTDWVLLSMAATAVVFLLFSRRRAWESVTVTVAVGGSWALNTFLQGIFKRQPPPGIIGPGLPTYSFPSQHSLLAFAFAGICAYLVWRHGKSRVRSAIGAALAVAFGLAVGLSRIFLALDYPSDVLAGCAVGAFWVATCVLGLETARFRDEQRR
ncbi:MAG: phosphatase PAP2 family protein [Chloroflexota bacterium]